MTKTAPPSRKTKPAAKSAAQAAPDANIAPKALSRGKTDAIVDLLRRAEGATIDDLMEATGWQAHSVRGALSGTVKKKLQLNLTSSTDGNTRVYRIVEAEA